MVVAGEAVVAVGAVVVVEVKGGLVLDGRSGLTLVVGVVAGSAPTSEGAAHTRSATTRAQPIEHDRERGLPAARDGWRTATSRAGRAGTRPAGRRSPWVISRSSTRTGRDTRRRPSPACAVRPCSWRRSASKIIASQSVPDGINRPCRCFAGGFRRLECASAPTDAAGGDARSDLGDAVPTASFCARSSTAVRFGRMFST